MLVPMYQVKDEIRSEYYLVPNKQECTSRAPEYPFTHDPSSEYDSIWNQVLKRKLVQFESMFANLYNSII